ncbi:M28 family peptidase [Nonomuraea cavernae]|uniref:M28 family peptidase n=1 Tax=Nonomuraea cavernae TaxID=2045107 RepID=UPI0033F5C127
MTVRQAVACVTLALLALAPAPAAAASPPGDLAGLLERQVDVDAVMAHLRHWERAADRHEGNRSSGTEALAESAGHLVRRLTGAGYRVTRQPVPYEDFAFDAERASQTAPATRELRVLMARWSPSLPPGGLDAGVAAPGAGSSHGCSAADYAGQDLTGAVVLLRWGDCAIDGKIRTAAGLGAKAALLYYPSPSPDNVWRIAVVPHYQVELPVASVSEAAARRLIGELTGGAARMRLDLRGHPVTGTAENILAETSAGDPGRVLMAGAHLDSVTEGPGVNDNGSSAAALLETALKLAPHQSRLKKQVRFAWWGAEELFGVGSAHYVAGLDEPGRRAIAGYLNYELIASPNHARFVLDGDDSDHPGEGSGPGPDGSAEIEAVFAGYFRQRGLPFRTHDLLTVRSDHEAFMAGGIPVGGLDGGDGLGVKTADEARVFGGRAGALYDPCYHQPCDRTNGLDTRALHENSRAIAWVLGRIASG